MAKLVVSRGELVLEQYFLDNTEWRVGRASDNRLRLDDPSVSKRHARVSLVGNDHILEDLESTNHTFVNGRMVKRCILQHEDSISIGCFDLRYINQRAKFGADFERTMVVDPLNEEGEADGLGLGLARWSPGIRPLGSMTSIRGPHAGDCVELSRLLAVFGRPAQQMLLINRRPHGYFMTHVCGAPARLNGRAIPKTGEQHLDDGDEIDVDGERWRFNLQAAD